MNYKKEKKKPTVKNTNTWRLNNTFLNNQQVTEEIKREIKKFLETNDNEHIFSFIFCLTCPILRKIHCHSSTNILLFFIIVLMFCIKYVDIKLFGIIFGVAYDCYIFILDFMFHPCYIILFVLPIQLLLILSFLHFVCVLLISFTKPCIFIFPCQSFLLNLHLVNSI